jgi:GNAT superfamily N-acetyltransferase
MASRLLILRRMNTIRGLYREGGIKAVIVRSVKKLMSPVISVGSLIFVECDLRKPLPRKAALAEVLAREAVLADASLFENPQIFIKRLRAGKRCFIGIDSATGKLANYRWIATWTEYIPEIDRDIVLRPGEAYSYDLRTLPEFRRRGIDAYTRNRTYQCLRDQGFSKVYAYIRADNFPMLKSSRPLLKPIGRVWYVRFRRSKCFVFGEHRNGLPSLVTTPGSGAGIQAA